MSLSPPSVVVPPQRSQEVGASPPISGVTDTIALKARLRELEKTRRKDIKTLQQQAAIEKAWQRHPSLMVPALAKVREKQRAQHAAASARVREYETLKDRLTAIEAASKPLQDVLAEVPWPHKFFRSFVSAPRGVVPTPFWRGIPITNTAALVSEGYFRNRTRDAIRGDVARWLAENEANLEAHFSAEVKKWVRDKERRAKKKAGPLKIAGALGALLPGVGVLVSAAIGAYGAKRMTEQQKKHVKTLYRELGIAEAGVEKFRNWILQWAAQPGFAVIVKDKGTVGTASTPEEAATLASAQATPGKPFTIVRQDTGQSVGYWLWTEQGHAAEIPEEAWNLPPERLTAAVERAQLQSTAVPPSTPDRFPWWLLPIAGALLL